MRCNGVGSIVKYLCLKPNFWYWFSYSFPIMIMCFLRYNFLSSLDITRNDVIALYDFTSWNSLPDFYEVCSINTRTEVIKMYFIWKLHVWVPFKVFSSTKHTLIPRVFPRLETVLAFSSFVVFDLIPKSSQIFYFWGFF